MKLTLNNLTTSFDDWIKDRCNKGVHFPKWHFTKSKTRILICTKCDQKIK